MDCFNVKDSQHCCHCYSSSYQDVDNYYDLEKFFICPGTHCVINSCIEWADGESGPYNYDDCCSSNKDPPCHDCSLLFCPLALTLDILCLLPRCFVSDYGYGNKFCKYIFIKCTSQKQDKESKDNNKESENENETITNQPK